MSVFRARLASRSESESSSSDEDIVRTADMPQPKNHLIPIQQNLPRGGPTPTSTPRPQPPQRTLSELSLETETSEARTDDLMTEEDDECFRSAVGDVSTKTSYFSAEDPEDPDDTEDDRSVIIEKVEIIEDCPADESSNTTIEASPDTTPTFTGSKTAMSDASSNTTADDCPSASVPKPLMKIICDMSRGLVDVDSRLAGLETAVLTMMKCVTENSQTQKRMLGEIDALAENVKALAAEIKEIKQDSDSDGSESSAETSKKEANEAHNQLYAQLAIDGAYREETLLKEVSDLRKVVLAFEEKTVAVGTRPMVLYSPASATAALAGYRLKRNNSKTSETKEA